MKTSIWDRQSQFRHNLVEFQALSDQAARPSHGGFVRMGGCVRLPVERWAGSPPVGEWCHPPDPASLYVHVSKRPSYSMARACAACPCPVGSRPPAARTFIEILNYLYPVWRTTRLGGGAPEHSAAEVARVQGSVCCELAFQCDVSSASWS